MVVPKSGATGRQSKACCVSQNTATYNKVYRGYLGSPACSWEPFSFHEVPLLPIRLILCQLLFPAGQDSLPSLQ